MREIARGLKNGIDVATYAKPEFGWARMQEIGRGIKFVNNFKEQNKMDSSKDNELSKMSMVLEDCFKDYIEADKDKEQHGADDIPPIFVNRRSKKR